VLWLDDADRFLDKGSLNSGVADTALHELGLQIVATMRNTEFTRLKKMDEKIGRDAKRVLDLAEDIKLDDMTPEEKLRTREAYPDLRLGPSLGESFISGRKLKERYKYGEPAMRFVVRAANDWRRTGFTAPIQRDDLFNLYKRLAPLQ